MPAFQLNVGVALQGKQGKVWQRTADGSFMDVTLNLSWPSLHCQGGDQLQGDELIQNSVVHPRSAMDGPVQGRSGFCFQCVYENNSKTLTFFAASQQDRDAWCKLMRQHAAHHNLRNAYEVSSKVLGSGAYATVYQGRDKVTGAQVAMKIIPRNRIDTATHPADERKLLITEVKLGLELQHQLLTKTTEFVENHHQYVIIMELMGGGDLFEYFKKRALTESEVQCIMRQLLVSVHFMHGRGIVHFDLKPENFLLSQV